MVAHYKISCLLYRHYQNFSIIYVNSKLSFKRIVNMNTGSDVYTFNIINPISFECKWNSLPSLRIHPIIHTYQFFKAYLLSQSRSNALYDSFCENMRLCLNVMRVWIIKAPFRYYCNTTTTTTNTTQSKI